MRCIVTAGPSYEPLDEVRRLTNMSTGRLGTELAGYLVERGHQVKLLLGLQATWPGRRPLGTDLFTTTENLRQRLAGCANETVEAVFHAAAASDFAFGKVWAFSEGGELSEVESGKISSGHARLVAELLPTPKIIASLRELFPKALLVGWKYEVEGDRKSALQRGQAQIQANRTDLCVVNGPAYGEGFGVVRRGARPAHLGSREALYVGLERVLGRLEPFRE